MIVKTLKKGNVNEILSLYALDFADGWNKNMLDSAFDGGRFLCLGAYQNDVLVGVITLSLSIDDADIEGIVTKKEFRNKGVASLLFDSAQKILKEKGIQKILLEVRETNIPAINFYKKKGFNQISIRRRYYPDGENALIFIKEN
ncbi:MAG: ribosomal-protein-alanine N-acetyltransferase [Clostridiales bacterium]|nr:ribosomal-protein-alanine N-acetyltransferase [Clostridiales bacterium]